MRTVKPTSRSERIDILEPLIRSFPLGFPFSRYAAVRQVRLARGAGKIDLLVVTDEPSILLIEAKHRNSPDAKDKVLGQLLLYLAHLDECGAATVSAAFHKALAYHSARHTSFWTGVDPTAEEVDTWIVEATSPRLRATRVRALIALDEWDNDSDSRRLGLAVAYVAARGVPLSIVLKSGDFVPPAD